MWFGVLGHLEVQRADGVSVALPGPARRTVLAALLCRVGRVVSASALIDDLWGAAAPRSAGKTLQSHIVRLRHDLAAGDGDGLLLTEGDGYRLGLEADDVDSTTFESLARDAASASDAGERDAALRLFERALKLWRDEAYLDFGDAPFAVSERVRLAELRSRTIERRVDLAMDCGRAEDLIADLEQRVRAEPYRERGWEQLVLALYRAGRQADALGAYRRARDLLAEDLGIDPGPGLRDLETGILRQDPNLFRPRVTTPAVAVGARIGECPYRGLAAYGERDAAFFVGRERLTAALAGRISEHSVVVVAGASGVGKSSLVRAGLVPVLRSGALPGSAAWRAQVLTPTQLAGSLSIEGSDVVVLDQAEEMFSSLDTTQRQTLTAGLGDYVDAGGRLLLVLRSDFYGQLAEVPEFAPYAERATVLVGPMREDELRRALVEPASAAGLLLEPALVETIMDEAAGQSEPLPHLSQAMVRTWEHRSGQTLTVAGYRLGGGLAGALEAAAEDCYAQLSEPAREAARHVLVRLVVRSGSAWVRRPQLRSHLSAADDPQTEEALRALVSGRLVLVDAERVEITHDSLVTYWPRLRDWLDERVLSAGLVDHLDQASTSWRDSGRQPADLYRGPRLQAALDWRAGHPSDLSLDEHEFLDASEAEATSELVTAHAQTRREARGRRRLRFVAIGLAAMMLVALVGGAAAAQARGTARQQARRAEQAALSADARRVAGLALTAPDIETSSLLAVAGYRLQDTPDTRNALLSVLERNDTALFRMPFPNRLLRIEGAADGRRLFVMDNARTISVVDPAQRKVLNTFPARAEYLDAASPDGKFIVVSGPASSPEDPGQVAVLDGSTGRVVAVLPVQSYDSGPPPVLSSDGRWLAVVQVADAKATSAGSILKLFDSHDWSAPPRTVRLKAPIVSAAAGLDRIAVATRDGELHLLSVPTLDALETGTPSGRTSAVSAQQDASYQLALSPDGEHLVLASDAVRAFDVTDLSRPGQLVASRTDVIDLGFSRDSHQLAIASHDGSVGVYDSSTLREVAQLAGHSGPALSLAWANEPSGAALYTVGLDSEMVRWDLRAGSRLVTESGASVATPDSAERFGNFVVGVTPSQDGSSTEQVYTFDLMTSRTRSWPLGLSAGDWVNQAIATADGRRALVSVEHDDGSNLIEVWDMEAGRRLTDLALPADADQSIPLMGALTPDGSRAVVSMSRDRVGVFAVPSGRLEREFRVDFKGSTGSRVAVVPWQFDPNGHMLLAGYDPGPPAPPPAAEPASTSGASTTDANASDAAQMRIGVLDLRSGRLIAQAGLGADFMTAVAWSPDRRDLLVGTNGGRLTLYDATTLAQRSDAGIAHSGPVLTASFSADGSTLVTGGTDGMQLWSVPALISEGPHVEAPDDVGSGWWYAWFGPHDTIQGLEPAPDRNGKPWESRFTFPGSAKSWVTDACRLADTDMTSEQWRRYLGARPYEPVCPH